GRQRLHYNGRYNPTAKGPVAFHFEAVPQVQLTGKNDLAELSAMSLEIQQRPDHLEIIQREQLCLVNQYGYSLPLHMPVHEELFNHVHLRHARSCGRQLEL